MDNPYTLNGGYTQLTLRCSSLSSDEVEKTSSSSQSEHVEELDPTGDQSTPDSFGAYEASNLLSDSEDSKDDTKISEVPQGSTTNEGGSYSENLEGLSSDSDTEGQTEAEGKKVCYLFTEKLPQMRQVPTAPRLQSRRQMKLTEV